MKALLLMPWLTLKVIVVPYHDQPSRGVATNFTSLNRWQHHAINLVDVVKMKFWFVNPLPRLEDISSNFVESKVFLGRSLRDRAIRMSAICLPVNTCGKPFLKQMDFTMDFLIGCLIISAFSCHPRLHMLSTLLHFLLSFNFSIVVLKTNTGQSKTSNDVVLFLKISLVVEHWAIKKSVTVHLPHLHFLKKISMQISSHRDGLNLGTLSFSLPKTQVSKRDCPLRRWANTPSFKGSNPIKSFLTDQLSVNIPMESLCNRFPPQIQHRCTTWLIKHGRKCGLEMILKILSNNGRIVLNSYLALPIVRVVHIINLQLKCETLLERH